MMYFHVISDISFLAEAELADGTLERLVAGVGEAMPRDLVLDAEALAANVARVRLLAGVRAHVMDQLLSSSEAFVAISTLVRKVVGVCSAMQIDGIGRRKRFAARLARIGPFAGVYAPMIVSGAFVCEAAAANVATVVLDAIVYTPQMSAEIGARSILLATYVTGEWTLAGMNPNMPNKASLCHYVLITIRALIYNQSIIQTHLRYLQQSFVFIIFSGPSLPHYIWLTMEFLIMLQ